MPWCRLRSSVAAAAVVVTVVAVGCSGGASPAAGPTTIGAGSTTRPTTFPASVCSSITAWQNRMVAATNAFSDASPRLTPADRKVRYLVGFDDHARITMDLRADLQKAPAVGVGDAESLRSQILAATEQVQQQTAEDRAAAAALPLSAYDGYGVGDGHLFTGTEKALSTVLKRLNEVGREANAPGLLADCGRG